MNNSTPSSFKRADGQVINFNESFFEQSKLEDYPLNIKNFHDWANRFEREEFDNFPDNELFHAEKFFGTQYFLNILDETDGINRNFGRILDIASGPAIKPRLLKLLNYVDEAWAIDVNNREDDFSEDRAFKLLNALEERLFASGKSDPQDFLKNSIENFKNIYGGELPIPEFLAEYRQTGDSSFETDEYIEDDIHDLSHDLPKFDLITAFYCMDHLDVPYIFDLVSDKLNKGGVFFIDVTNWYHMFGGNLFLPMDSPWLHARMNLSDLFRYYDEIRPELSEDVRKAVYFESPHLTTTDFKEIGKSSGLDLKYQKHVIDDKLLNIMLTSFNFIYETVLPQSQDINPNVTLKSLFRKYRTLVFEKT